MMTEEWRDDSGRTGLNFGDSWLCPHCRHYATIGEKNSSMSVINSHESANPQQCFVALIITCLNSECGKNTVVCDLFTKEQTGDYAFCLNLAETWQLTPYSALPFPDYVPAGIRQDYAEACSILDASPKSAATLARRCLQGMIRDFWNVKKANLAQEIAAIESKVNNDATWKAIDAVRKLGNIGAHMEKEVDRVVDIEPGEAKKLIWLVEFLIRGWYVARAEQEEQLAEIAEIGRQKEAQRKGENNGDPDDTPF